MQPAPEQRRSALYWLGRYGPQDLSAAAAACLWCIAIEDLRFGPPTVGLTSAAVETGTFYAVAFARVPGASLRPRGLRVGFRELLAEYGLAELLDLVLRPALMILGVTHIGAPAGVLVGSLVADVAFYTLAAILCVRRGL